MILLIYLGNMNYELAKELKDVGFPNSNKWFEKYWYCNSDFSCGNTTFDEKITEKPCYCGWNGWRSDIENPTVSLEELIEACGDLPFVLQKMSEWHGGKWIATSANKPTLLSVTLKQLPDYG